MSKIEALKKAPADLNLVREANRIFYEVEAGQYDIRHPEVIIGDRKWWEEVALRYLRPKTKKETIRVIDIGSGTGFVGEIILNHLTEKDLLICYDISVNMLKKSQEKFGQSFKHNIGFVNGEADSLPFNSHSFDLITINSVLHHLADCSGLLIEANRLLKKGGYVVIGHEPNKSFFNSRITRLAASCYKLLGCGMFITDEMQAIINSELKKGGYIRKYLSKEEILRMVEYHSPVEQAKFSVRKDKGFIPRDLINGFFLKYKVVQLEEYSTYFVRPLFKNISWLGALVEKVGCLLFGKSNLFRFVLQKT